MSDSIWDPAAEPHLFATGTDVVGAGWVSTGFVVTQPDGVRLFSDEGELLGAYVPESVIHSAVVEDDVVVVVEDGQLHRLGVDLDPIGSTPWATPCLAGSFMDSTTLLCSSFRSADEPIFAIDLTSGAATVVDAWVGSPAYLRRVPGHQQFLASSSATSDVDPYLFSWSSGEIEYVGEGPSNQQISGLRMVFLGMPADRVLASGGELLRLHDDHGGCADGTSLVPGEDCLLRSGTLGLLPSGVRSYFHVSLGMDGYVYGVYSSPGDGLATLGAEEELRIQRIDVDARAVLAERTVISSEVRSSSVYPDPAGRGAVVLVHEESPLRLFQEKLRNGSWDAYIVGL